MSSPLPSSASVVIIGGGVMGTSIAWHLAAAGVTGVLLLEAASSTKISHQKCERNCTTWSTHP